jgi:hypothetical protein
MFKDYPATGVGLGSFILQLPNYYELNNADTRQVDFAGNYYLQIMAELGLPGLLLILMVFYVILKKVFIYYRDKKRKKALVSSDWALGGMAISFICVFLVLFFGSHTSFHEVQLAFWSITGLIFVYMKINMDVPVLQEVKRADSKNSLPGDSIKGPVNSKVKEEEIKQITIGSLNISNNIGLKRGQKYIILALAVAYAGLFFFYSFTSLSINVQQNIIGYKNNYGFYNYENVDGRKIRWTGIDASEVLAWESDTIKFEIKAITPGIEKKPVFIRFFYNNRLLKTLMVKDIQWKGVELVLPGGQEKDKFTFTVSSNRSWVPKLYGISSDTRELGIMVTEFK